MERYSMSRERKTMYLKYQFSPNLIYGYNTTKIPVNYFVEINKLILQFIGKGIRHKMLFCCPVAKSCLTLWDLMNCSTPGFPVLHYLPQFAQTHVHQVNDAIQPSHPLLPRPLSSCQQTIPESGSFSVSQLFISGGQNIRASVSASILPVNIQGWFPGLTGLISLLSKVFQEYFNATVQKYQFFSSQPSLWSNSHIHTWLLEKP